MARNQRNDQDRKVLRPQDVAAQKKGGQQDEEQQQQVETEVEQVRDVQQDQLGNQEIAAILGIPSMAPGSAGLGIEGDERDYDLGIDFGGDDDDDLPNDGPQTLAELTREWNKGTRRGRDTTSFEEPMPAEDLPPVDQELAARIRVDPDHPPLPPTDNLDPLLQPSEQVIAGDIGSWLKEAIRWSGGELPHRTLAHAVHPVAPPLLDPHGRVFLARARAGAIATLLMRDGPVLREAPTPAVTAFVDVCLELAGQRHTVLDVWWRAQQSDAKLPVGADVLRSELSGRRSGPGPSVELPHPAHEHVELVMQDLVDIPSAATLVPYVSELEPDLPDDDDPLGIDDVLDAFTGGRPDPLESLYDTVILGAERLASAVARARVRFAGLGRALCEVGDQWITGAPVEAVLKLVSHADEQGSRVLRLIVEIAQAAKRRSVDPQGIRNGLRRAARMLDKLVRTTIRSLAALVGGILHAVPVVPDVFVPDPDDPLVGAWADGHPVDALPFLLRQPDGWDREASVLFTRVGAGHAPADLADPLLALANAPQARPHLGEAARIIAGACMLWEGRTEQVLAIAERHMTEGHARRNGLLMASGALLAMEAHHQLGDAESLREVQYEVGKTVWHMGQRAAFTLLMRWHPPEAQVDLLQAFFDG